MFYVPFPRPSSEPESTWTPASPPTPENTRDPAHFLDDLDHRFTNFMAYARETLGHSAVSVEGYRGAYRNFRKFLVESDNPESKFYAIEEWVAWNRRRKLGAVSVNTYWRSLRPFFNDLAKRDGLQNSFNGLRQPVLPSRVAKAYPPAECQRILAAAENIPWQTEFERWRAVAVFATILYAGLRRRELLNLRYVDVDMQLGVIHVWRGKGRAGGKDRTVYLAPNLRDILTRYLRERIKRKIEGAGFFSTMQGGGQGMCMSTLRRIHARVRRAAGLRFTLHGLRHSFVTELLRSGVPIHVAKELAGHTNITTTAGYLRVWDEDLKNQIQKLSYGRA